MPEQKNDRIFFLFILIPAVLMRFVLLATAHQFPERALAIDSSGYILPAEHLLAHGAYSFPSAIRTPLYPMFIALCYAIFGANTFPVVITQYLLNAGTVFLTYKTALFFTHRKQALLASALFALGMESLISPFFILTESLFTFLLVSSTYALVRYRQDQEWKWIALTWSLVALAILTRPIAVFYPVLVILFIMAATTQWRERARSILIGAVILAIVLLPWILRNYFILGSPTLTTISAKNLLYYEAAPLEADLRHLPVNVAASQLRALVDETLAENNLPDTEMNRARVSQKIALEVIAAHPFRFVYVHSRENLKGLLPGVSLMFDAFGVEKSREDAITTLRFDGLQAFLGRYRGKAWILLSLTPALFILGLVYGGSVAGTAILFKQGKWFELVVPLFSIMYFLGLAGGASNARFRVPVMPYFCILAAIGLVYCWTWILSKRKANHAA